MILDIFIKAHKIEEVLATIQPEATLAQAADLIMDKHVGSLLVLEGTEPLFHKVRGILTKTDIVRAVREGKCPGRIQVGSQMTKDLVVATVDDDMDYVLKAMARHNITHVPVIRKPKVVALISVGDLLRLKYADTATKIHYLKDFQSGSYGNQDF